MRGIVRSMALMGLLATAACAGGGGPPQPFQGPGENLDRPAGQETFTQALSMREKQGCAAAIPPLRRFASYGGGYEVAQFELGDCLVEEARAATDAVTRQNLADEALTNLLKAANSNEPNSQGLLAELYFRGDIIPRDKLAAGMWLRLYQRNNLRINLGARPLASGLEADMLKGLSKEEWAEADSRAGTFQPVVQPTRTPAQQVGPQMPRRPGFGRPSGEEGQGDRRERRPENGEGPSEEGPGDPD